MKTPNSTLDLTGTGYCAAFNFRRAARAITRLFDRTLERGGMRSTQFAILVAVAKTQPASISSLAELTSTDSTTLTRNLGVLVRDGWITISPRGAKRQRLVSIAPRGAEALARALRHWREVQSEFVAAIGTEYWKGFRSDLERMAGLAARLQAGR